MPGVGTKGQLSRGNKDQVSRSNKGQVSRGNKGKCPGVTRGKYPEVAIRGKHTRVKMGQVPKGVSNKGQVGYK